MGYKFNVFTGKLDIAGLSSIAGGDHSTLSNLDYASAGHTGFEPTVTKGNLTEATSSILTITGGTGSVIGSGTTIQVSQASTSTSGYLSSTDWNTFNGKQNALTFGIADNNAVEIDSASVASGEYAKFTANGLESKSFAEVKTDLSLNNVENTALSTWAGTANITTLGTIATGTWNGTTIAIANGGTGQTTQQAAIDALTAVAGATNEHVLTKDTATGNAIWKAASGGGAPTNATYITQTPDATLTNEQALSALATGLLKNTTTTGVLSIAAAGTDYDNYWTRTGTVLTARTAGDDLNITGTIRNLADNSKHIFGAGNDAEIYYDATDLIINPKAVGTGIVKISGSCDVALDMNVSTAGYGYQLGGVDVLNDYTQAGGSNCLWIGHQAGLNAISGTGTPIRVMAVGRQAGYSLTTASDSIFIGYQAGYSATGASTNVVVGNYAGYNLTTGTNSLLFGYKAGYSLTTQSGNLLMGYVAGENLTGSGNTAIGYNTLNTATNADDNTAIGSGALFNVTTGGQNTGIGTSSGGNITTGSANLCIGMSAGPSITTGSSNVIIGPINVIGAGYTTNTSDRLFIGKGATDTPLIDGDFANTYLKVWGDIKSPDDYRHYFGTGDDVSIRWDAPNSEWTFLLDEQTPAGSDLVVDSTSDAYTLRLKNGAKVYQLEYKGWAELEPNEMGWGAAGAPAKATWINDGLFPPSVGVVGAIFMNSLDADLYGSTKLSGQYEENTDIIPMVNWSPTDASPGNVVWQLEWTAQIPGVAFPFTVVSTIVVPSNNTQWILNEDAFDPIPGNLIRYVIDFRLSRLGMSDHRDDYRNAVVLHGIAFYNSCDTIGSRTQLTK